jgi:hypothetical protein
MGMFKNMRDLTKQARDLENSMPPVGDRMRAAQERMADVSQMMAAQTQAANMAAAAASGLSDGSSVRRNVVISSMQQVGQVNFDLLIQFDLTVMPDGMPPYPATIQQTVSQMLIGRVQPGVKLQAAVDRSNPQSIWLDFNTIGS